MTTARLQDFIKAYDVRGLVPEQLSPAVATALGSAYAQVVVIPEGATAMVIGHDMRPSSPELSRAFAAGAAAHGVDVTMIGLCSTDGLYYASGARSVPGAMFTASHNPATYNGIKLCRSGARPVGLDSGLAEVRDLAQWLLDRGAEHDLPAGASVGSIDQADLLDDYADFLHSLVDLSEGRPLKVVVDAGNGMAGHTVPAVLQRSNLPLEIVPLYFELDGTFPNHEANPLEPENLRDLQAAVLAHGADLGLAFDGDADRCFVVDERGEPVTPSAITALVAAREIAREVAAGVDPAEVAVVHNVICSRVVPETISQAGARPVRTRVGHSYIKAHMAEHDAVFGGEHSAHYYFRDFWFADTGMLAAMHVLAALGGQRGALSDLVASYERYAGSGEINSLVEDVPAATARVRAWGEEQGASVDLLDGLTMGVGTGDEFWWISLRPSNTEPLLRLNVEASDEATMTTIRDEVLRMVRA
ncbi:phosphomannomutase/phosphoglucomutase [Ornithinimicrobium faecis]|uniref:Phosphomannomutase/phosphoglucomutase n=1 Tax=Ornithinimicrobium faecis TaxID=2934158 RepID=A0ABY4YPN9_9MICO|nr:MULTISPECIES: phosphomannomutase/phosphoglucomutase [unclassified Ornithinimicrobium]USQ78729.1 phosphomannomutase/phosphoglucomutase [Ornithinimicrobium sp. HY1793]